MTSGKWLKWFFIIFLSFMAAVGVMTAVIDPYFHYHAPLSSLYYRLDEQRSQNDGITKRFDYDAVITGTSMVENFKSTEFDGLFGVKSVKLPYPGATFREVGDNLRVAFDTHDDIRLVLRALDESHLIESSLLMRTDMGEYPNYLYDKNPFNDVRYLFNRTVIMGHCLPMLADRLRGREGGVQTFDSYSYSGDDEYGEDRALEGRTEPFGKAKKQRGLTDEERELVISNMEYNVIAAAEENPDARFICFFPPYSAVWYLSLREEGLLDRDLEAMRLAVDMMLECDNIEVYVFADDPEITMDLSRYKDAGHYSPEISSIIMERMSRGEGRLDRENADRVIDSMRELYMKSDIAVGRGGN